MAVGNQNLIVVKAVPDRNVSSAAGALGDSAGAGVSSDGPFIRRPTRGIQLKDDTFATIRLVAGSGSNYSIIDAGSKRKDKTTNTFFEIDGKRATDVYSNFLLQQVSEERMEKSQVLETFGEPYIFFFGERPRVMNFSGVLANTWDFNWEAEWWANYDKYLRGTRCVENDARVYISFDNTLVGGYILSSSASKSAQERNFVQFQFQLFVTYYDTFSNLGNPYAYPAMGNKAAQTVSMDAASAGQYRPALLSDYSTQDGPLVGNGQTTQLFQSIESGIAQVGKAWKDIQNTVDNALSFAGGLLNSDLGVKVPVGFAGVMEFDDKVNLVPVSYDASVTYSTFADNEDEYVGVGVQGSQYGTSIFTLTDTAWTDQGYGWSDLQSTLDYGNEMVRQASLAFAKAGISIPQTSLGPVASFLVSKGLGLVAVGASSLIQSASSAGGAGVVSPGALIHSSVGGLVT